MSTTTKKPATKKIRIHDCATGETQSHPPKKDTNPKDAIGVGKVPMSCLSFPVLMEMGLGMMEGGSKSEEVHKMRTFDSGATRDADDDKLDFDGFLSPLSLEEFAQYMHSHRIQADGKMRDSGNWKKGIPLGVYMKSMWRHFFDLWKIHCGIKIEQNGSDMTAIEACCALMFNVQGYLHESVSKKQKETKHEPKNG